MSGLPGLGGILGKIPVIGGALAAAAPVVQGAASLVPGLSVANLALDAAANGINSGADSSNATSPKTQSSAITF